MDANLLQTKYVFCVIAFLRCLTGVVWLPVFVRLHHMPAAHI